MTATTNHPTKSANPPSNIEFALWRILTPGSARNAGVRFIVCLSPPSFLTSLLVSLGTPTWALATIVIISVIGLIVWWLGSRSNKVLQIAGLIYLAVLAIGIFVGVGA